MWMSEEIVEHTENAAFKRKLVSEFEENKEKFLDKRRKRRRNRGEVGGGNDFFAEDRGSHVWGGVMSGDGSAQIRILGIVRYA
jgi:hypothetical protein